MKTFHLTVSTPFGNRFDGECVKFDVRGIEGSLAVMAGHIPFVTAIKKGECRLLLEDGTELVGEADGGILSVDTDRVTLVSGSFDLAEEA